MSVPAATRRALASLAIVSAAALLFALLLLLVRLQWAPLESADHGAATGLNSLVAGDSAVVSIVKAVTWLGSGGVLWTLIGAAAVVLALRRRWRLTAYLLVTGAGALVLDPVLKALVGRLRPVVAHPIAHGNGNSFPSGHALGSVVCYGLPARDPRDVAPRVHRRDRHADRRDRNQPAAARRALSLRRAGRLGAWHHLAGHHRLRLRTIPPGRRGAGDPSGDPGP